MSLVYGIQAISPETVAENTVAGNLPDRPSQPSLYGGCVMTSGEVKAAYDKLPKLIVDYYNALVASIGGMTGGELDKESLAAKIQTGIQEGHTLRDLFCDIKDGQFASYLSLDGDTTLLEFLENLSVETTQVGEDAPTADTPGVVGSLYFSLALKALFVCVLSEENGRTWTKLSHDLASEESDGLMSSADKCDLAIMKGQIADLLYKAIAITSFTNDVNTVEVGSTVDNVKLSWKTNKTPQTLTLGALTLDAAATSYELTSLGLIGSESFTLTATDERGAVATKTTSVRFLNGVYYGAGTAEEIASGEVTLTKVLTDTKARSFTVSAAEGQYIWYLLPKRLGECRFQVGGFDGGFSLDSEIGFTNASGYTEDYAVYRSDNASLGETTVTVA